MNNSSEFAQGIVAFVGRIESVDIRRPDDSIVIDGAPEIGHTLFVTCKQDTVQ